MPGSSTAEADTEYQRLAAQVITTPALRLALLNSTVADQASHVQKILDDSVVQAHFSDRVAFVSCDEAASIEVAVACLASGLGLEPNDDGIGAILGYVMATGRTLVVLDNFHAIYSPADPEQQEATDVLLATLAAVDEVTLVITFCGSPLPECVAWTNMDDATDHTANSEPSAAKLPQDVAPPAMVSCLSDAYSLTIVLIMPRLHSVSYALRKMIALRQFSRPLKPWFSVTILFLLPVTARS